MHRGLCGGFHADGGRVPVTVTTGLVDTFATPTLLRLLAAGQLDVSTLITHRFPMPDFLDAYDVFAEPARTGALKVLVTAG